MNAHLTGVTSSYSSINNGSLINNGRCQKFDTLSIVKIKDKSQMASLSREIESQRCQNKSSIFVMKKKSKNPTEGKQPSETSKYTAMKELNRDILNEKNGISRKKIKRLTKLLVAKKTNIDKLKQTVKNRNSLSKQGSASKLLFRPDSKLSNISMKGGSEGRSIMDKRHHLKKEFGTVNIIRCTDNKHHNESFHPSI